MLLVLLSLAVVAPYALLTLAGRLYPAARVDRRIRAKVGISLLFVITGITHFTHTADMAAMMPPQLPFRTSTIYITGVLELLGAIGIWSPRRSRLAGAGLIVLLVSVLPANAYAAYHHLPFGGHGGGPMYLLVRVPFQLLLIAWIYYATEQRWLDRFLPQDAQAAATNLHRRS